MLRLSPVLLLVFVLATASQARAPHVGGVEILEWGIFQAEVLPASPTDNFIPVTNERLQQTTTTIPALVGIQFGYRFKVVGPLPGKYVRLKLITRFPSQGLTDPATGKTYSSEFDADVPVGRVGYLGKCLAHDWQVEPGPWILEIWYDGRKLAEKTFMVTRLSSSVDQLGGCAPRNERLKPLSESGHNDRGLLLTLTSPGSRSSGTETCTCGHRLQAGRLGQEREPIQERGSMKGADVLAALIVAGRPAEGDMRAVDSTPSVMD